MSADWKPPEELWKEFLAWLDPDPEIAAQKYEEIRAALIAFFVGRRWACAEDMADEVINRVMRRGDELFDTYVGEPKYYFKKAAHHLHLDYLKQCQPLSAREPTEAATRPAFDSEERAAEESRYACLEDCIQRLSQENRELAIRYHEQSKSAKIRDHKALAAALGITVNALRLRIFRIHGMLRDCVTKCLQA
jgi:DNA-directed RNA polymerase specialized sigma24 family protein